MKKADHEISLHQDEEALKTLIQIISLDENHRKANELLGKLYQETGDIKKAELIFKHLIELFPFDPAYYSALGAVNLVRHLFRNAIKYYEKSLSLDKNNPIRYVHLGQAYSSKKDYAMALEWYTKAHRLHVSNIELMFLMVETCLFNSDPIKAREYLHKILDYEPYNQQAKTILAEVLQTLSKEGA
jgi:tetratricopeptide (TPR) repeat protein